MCRIKRRDLSIAGPRSPLPPYRALEGCLVRAIERAAVDSDGLVGPRSNSLARLLRNGDTCDFAIASFVYCQTALTVRCMIHIESSKVPPKEKKS